MNRTLKPCSWLVYESQVLDTTNRGYAQLKIFSKKSQQ